MITDSLNILCPLEKIAICENQPGWLNGEAKTAIRAKAFMYKKGYITKIGIG